MLADQRWIERISQPKLTSFIIYLTDKNASVTVGR